MSKVRLSQKQIEVLTLMTEGWQLGKGSAWAGGRYWLQKNGIGKGGETKSVHANLMPSLLKNAFVASEKYGQFKTFRLTEAGKNQLKLEIKKGPQ